MYKIRFSQFAGMNIHYWHYPFLYFLDSMEKLGIRNIEIWAASPHVYIEDLDLKEIKRIKKEITKRKLNVICLTPEQCIYPVNIAAKESNIRERSLNFFYNNIELASELNTKMVLITPGWGYFSETKEEAWKRSRDSIIRLIDKAKMANIELVLEPISSFNTKIINNVDDLYKMLFEIDSPYLKGMLDLGQMAIIGEKIKDYFDKINDRLVHIHFIDSNKDGAHLALGDGVLPLKSYLSILSKLDYKGYLSLEIADKRYYLDPEKAMKKSIDKIEQLL